VLLSIALARYPHQYEWRSASGIVYLIFLVTLLLTGVVGLARGLPRAARRSALSPAAARETKGKQDNRGVNRQPDNTPGPKRSGVAAHGQSALR